MIRSKVLRDERFKHDSMSPDPVDLEASVITKPLDSLIGALGNKIDREWPKNLSHIWGARELFLLTLRTADVTSRSIRYLCAEKPPDPARRLEYCLSAPPLNRTILDNLFTVLFVSEDIPTRCAWYHKAAWREERLELERYRSEYGHLPEWQEWLDRMADHSDLGIEILAVPPGEVSDPSKMTRWPNPGAMIRYGISAGSPLPPTRTFMKYLNDWFYADLSQQAHLGGAGLMKRATALLYEPNDTERQRALTRNKYAWVGQTITLTLALATELEAHLRFGLSGRISYLWGLTAPVIVIAKEVYDERYAALLAAIG
jgi:hypothetical protein